MKFWTLLGRSLRLRCPRCGMSRLFRNLWSMNNACDQCGLSYEREPGFFLGTIYFNYGLTALIAAISYPVMVFGYGVSQNVALAVTMTFVVLFPMWFFRYARSLWLGFDQYVDPRSD